jgi:hypothetical protein
LVFVVGEVGRLERSASGPWLGKRHFWVDGSAIAFPHGERSEIASIRSAPSREPSAKMEEPAEPSLPPRVLTALLMLD